MLSVFFFASPLVSWHRMQGTLIESGKEFEARDIYVKWSENGVKYFRPAKVGELRLSELYSSADFFNPFVLLVYCLFCKNHF